MGLSRRFLNLIVCELPDPNFYRRVVSSLRIIDLGRHELFYPPGTMPPPASKVEQLTLPTPTISFKAYRWGYLPVGDRKVLCTGQWRRQHAFLFDAATQHVVTIPTRRVIKGMPTSVFVPSGDADDDDPNGTLFVMETWPDHEKRRPEPESGQFEALVYRRTSMSSSAKSWQSQLLPPLPYLRNPKYWKFNVGITSYAVVGDGSHICVSLEQSVLSWSDERSKIKKEIAGTYCLDTVSHTWSKAGDWTLPFVGKVEYVPELKLWFGISSGDGQLAAADLSDMDSEPQLLGAWEVKADGIGTAIERNGRVPFHWSDEYNKLAYLGSGRFCFARFFKHEHDNPHERVAEHFAVLIGVEVTPQAHDGSRDDGAEAKLQMIMHKSRLVPSDTCIDAVF